MRRSIVALAHLCACVVLLISTGACGNNRPDEAGLHTSPYERRSYAPSNSVATDSFAIAPAPSANSDIYTSDRAAEEYNHIYEHDYLAAAANPLSTFSIDVDAASYSNVRRMINEGTMPEPDAVRVEELVNYFTYEYPQPRGEDPFSITTEVAPCPWNSEHKLVSIGLQGRTMDMERIPANNLVFLVDVSGSMNQPAKLPLVKEGLTRLTRQLREDDRVAIVVYAGSAGVVLPSTPGSDRRKIARALDQLEAGGSTAGGEGIQLAYRIARENFTDDGNNRVILCTDGDFNVGVSSEHELVNLIEEKRRSGIYLTVLGFGAGNYKDSRMEQLADKGNGNYYYIDNENEAQKVLVNQLGSTLFAIAKDVKVQVEFNPEAVKEYRLVGYENRALAARDFNDDSRDAGELGAGHTVTALYEIVPVAGSGGGTEPGVDPLKYQPAGRFEVNPFAGELMTVKLRYKHPKGSESRLLTRVVTDGGYDISGASRNLRFAAAVVEWGMLLRGSKYSNGASYDQVLSLARSAVGDDPNGYRREFITLVEATRSMSRPM